MKAFSESLPPTAHPSFSCFEVKAPTLGCPYHAHPEFEIIHILSSYGRRFIGNSVDTFEPGDFILLGSEVPHMYYTDPKESLSPSWAHAHVLHFFEHSLNKQNPPCAYPHLVYKLLKRSSKGLRFLGQERKQAAILLDRLLHANRPSRDPLLCELLDVLATSEHVEELNPESNVVKIDDSETARRFNQACEFINENFASNFPQSVIADTVDMSPSTFSRFFKVTSGKPFVQFMTDIRIEQACRLLRETNMSIMEVGNACGFTNLSNFNRRFKSKMHQTPLKYRQNYILSGVWRNNEVT